ncbi:MAG: DUF3592 domain-containing protein [Oscillospiraceae bacterium]|nr:DUF3592 domain-containing protein [Oscillospiraceae bacterium]
MKLKKRYIVACVLLCIAALALCVGVFNIEMGLARYAKLNKVTSQTWKATSASEVGNRVNSDLLITNVIKKGDESFPDDEFPYIGEQCYVKGKYVAYGQDAWGGGVLLNGKNPDTGESYKLGDKVSIYYKPDNPKLTYATTNYTIYIILLVALFVAAIALIIVCRIVNKSMKDNTFSDAAVTIMDIPMAVIVAGFILTFFAGMLMGNIQVDSTYTAINDAVAAGIEAGEIAF